ncbi:MAG: methyltransferase domain-containing protein [Pseudomonadota bacterium]
MFSPNITGLQKFYGSPLGQLVQRKIAKIIEQNCGEIRNSNIVGIGFATPYLLPLLHETNGVFACMPAAQGVLRWPTASKNLALLADESLLPFADNSVQAVIVVHGLENSEQGRKMLDEIHRILAPMGKLILIVPNRHGIWTHSDNTPFSYGRPFTLWQLRHLLLEHELTPIGSDFALFFPPWSHRYILKLASLLEKIGRSFFRNFGGVCGVIAEKQIYATIKSPLKSYAKPSYIGLARPVMSKNLKD